MRCEICWETNNAIRSRGNHGICLQIQLDTKNGAVAITDSAFKYNSILRTGAVAITDSAFEYNSLPKLVCNAKLAFFVLVHWF